MIGWTQDYEVLVAAFALRDREFAAEYGGLLLRAAPDFFGHYGLRDVVIHGLGAMKLGSKLLPAAALKADMIRVGNKAVNRDTYAAFIDAIFACPLEGREHVAQTLLAGIKSRMLLALDPKAYVAAGLEKEYFARIQHIAAIGMPTKDAIVGVVEGLDELVDTVPQGVPTGFPTLDTAFNGGGVCPGELLVILGRYNIGKSRFLHNVAVNAAFKGLGVFVVSFETSLRNTRRRILKTALGWTDQMILSNPDLFKRKALETLLQTPIAIKYTSGFDYTFEKMGADIRRFEDKMGKAVSLVVRDYGELMAREPDDYRSVRESYKGFKDYLGVHGIAGVDAAQKNRGGDIGFFSLLKDADILVDLDTGGSETLLLATVKRNREGPCGHPTMIVVNKDTGKMLQYGGPSVKEEDTNEGKPDGPTPRSDGPGNGVIEVDPTGRPG